MQYLISKQKIERRVKGDIKWENFTFLIPFLALVIGVLSSLLGIGGGELMGPLLLHLKVRGGAEEWGGDEGMCCGMSMIVLLLVAG